MSEDVAVPPNDVGEAEYKIPHRSVLAFMERLIGQPNVVGVRWIPPKGVIIVRYAIMDLSAQLGAMRNSLDKLAGEVLESRNHPS